MNDKSAQQAESRLGVTIRTIRKWAKENRIPGTPQHRRSWMIPADFVPKSQQEARPKYVGPQFTNDCAAGLLRKKRIGTDITEPTGY